LIINIIKNIFLIFLMSCFALSGHIRSAGLTTLFEYSQEKQVFYLNNNFKFLKNKKIGLIINHTSKVPINELREYGFNSPITTFDLFKNADLNVVRIFSPEHGFSGQYAAGEEVPSTSDVVSLYGKDKSPRDEYLKDIDVLIFDIQDIGARYYTYLSTMQLCMEKAAQNNVDFIVLDRPNPLGRKIEGAILDLNYKSFVGMNPIPARHGMTAGEIAIFIKENKLIKSAADLSLQVITGTNWDQDYSVGGRCKVEFEQTSPNIPSLEHALIYIGTCLLEGTNISEGRGTDNPFKLFGAPWLDSEELIKTLNQFNFKDVDFIEKSFTPSSSKFKGEKCNGVQIEFSNLNIDAFKIGVTIINEIYKKHPDKFEFKDNFFDKLYGSSDLRLAISNGKSLDDLFNKIDIQNVDFSKKMVTIY
tara:strand:- start:204 stop:1454 length:1251 start_codon:yes stop_codon:yes gene_type:complete